MKTTSWFIALFSICSLIAFAQSDRPVQSSETPGRITFNKLTNAIRYRIEWFSPASNAWTNFGMPQFDAIVSPGTGTVTVNVPMLYRVKAGMGAPEPVMVLIAGGTFETGDAFAEGEPDELPVRTNVLSAFYIEDREVTKEVWDYVKAFDVDDRYQYSNPGSGKGATHPVQGISWFDAVKWCNARSEKYGLTPCYTSGGQVYRTGIDSNVVCDFTANGFRLPTEAEWEAAARGGLSGKRFPSGDTISHAEANYFAYPFTPASTNGIVYDVNPGSGFLPAHSTGGFPFTSPAASFAPNGFGLHDMAGNVWEWCWDLYDAAYYSSSTVTNPTGPATSDSGTRVLRGGAWEDYAPSLRVSQRGFLSPASSYDSYGFRCVRTATGSL